MASPCRNRIALPARVSPPTLRLEVQQLRPELKAPVRFDAAFVERRLQEHNEWREQEELRIAAPIVREIEIAFVRKLNAAADIAEKLAAEL